MTKYIVVIHNKTTYLLERYENVEAGEALQLVHAWKRRVKKETGLAHNEICVHAYNNLKSVYRLKEYSSLLEQLNLSR